MLDHTTFYKCGALFPINVGFKWIEPETTFRMYSINIVLPKGNVKNILFLSVSEGGMFWFWKLLAVGIAALGCYAQTLHLGLTKSK